MPDARPDCPPTLLGMSQVFKLETKALRKLEQFKSQVLFRSCDSDGTLPNCINNSTTQNYSVVTGHGQPQPIGSQLTLEQGK